MATPEAIITLASRDELAVQHGGNGAGLAFVDRESLLEAAESGQRLQTDARKLAGQELRRTQAAGLAGAAALHVVGGQGLHHPCHRGGRNLQGRGRDGLCFDFSFYLGLNGQRQGHQQAAGKEKALHGGVS